MKKVLILYNRLFHYRLPVWNLLARKCQLTVAYSEGSIPQGLDIDFNIIHLPYKRIGPIIWHKDDIRKLASNYDAVIAYGEVRWLKYILLSWLSRVKVFYWGIGVSSSKGYDVDRSKDFIQFFAYRKATGLIFYTDYPINKYIAHGFKRETLFVANNTVEVHPIDSPSGKNYILFIGTLHKRKGLNLLLDNYLVLKKECNLPKLVLVGDGPERNSIKEWIRMNQMDGLIEMKGSVTDQTEKAEIFSKAIACISPKQAGLSVLECMGHGVPFVTTKDAITGGELFNIHDGVDGIVMANESQLSAVIKDISKNPFKYVEMGKKAKLFYDNNRTAQQMADGLWSAVEYALNK